MLARIALLCFALLCTVATVRSAESFRLPGADTLQLAGISQAENAGALSAATPDTVRKRDGFMRRIIRYFGNSNVDRTFEKKIDFSFAGGPSYSKNTSLGIGLLAAGLYRVDRTDSVTVPSDVSLFVNASITGYYAVGVSGNTLFDRGNQRVFYTLMFSSAPTSFWGIGHDAGSYNPESNFSATRYTIEANYMHRVGSQCH